MFPDETIVATLSQQLSWSHFVEILPLKQPLEREYYADLCRVKCWDKSGTPLPAMDPCEEQIPPPPLRGVGPLWERGRIRLSAKEGGSVGERRRVGPLAAAVGEVAVLGHRGGAVDKQG